jgi:hypothetical protein
MATYDKTLANDNAVQAMSVGQKVCKLVKITFDGTMGAAGDVIQAVKVPVGATVTDVKLMVPVKLGANATMDVGYGSDVDYFLDGVNVNANGVIATANAATAATPLTISAGSTPIDEAGYDTIDIKMATADAAPNANLVCYLQVEYICDAIS